MGYNYYFLLTLEHTGGVNLAEIESVYFPLWTAAYKALITDDWFPTFTEVEHSGSGGYGTGGGDRLIPTFTKFTSQFPNQTFGLHLVYWDLTNIESYRFKGTTGALVGQTSYEEVKLSPAITATITINPDNLSIDDDITYLFDSTYRKVDDLHWSAHPEAVTETGVSLEQIWLADVDALRKVLAANGSDITSMSTLGALRDAVAKFYLERNMLAPSAAVLVRNSNFTAITNMDLDTARAYLRSK